MSFIEPPFWARYRWGDHTRPHVGLSLLTPPTLEPLSIAEVQDHLNLDDASGEPAPASAPTLTLASAGAGLLENGSHRVALSYGTADGETPPGPLSAPITVADHTVNGQISVSAIPAGGANVTTIKIWMPPVGALAPLLYAGSVANGVTATTLNLADASLGAQAPTVNTTANAGLAGLITDARQYVEGDTERSLPTQTWQLTHDRFPSSRRWITIPRPPLQSVTRITYVDADGVTQTLDPATYSVDAPAGPHAPPGRILPVAGTYFWPFPGLIPVLNGVTVEFVAGYGPPAAVPGALKRAMKLLIGNWFMNREGAELIRGSADVLPFGVDDLLQPFRLVSVA